MCTVIQFPVIYRIAWAYGEFSGHVRGFETRHLWEAEYALSLCKEAQPDLILWIDPPPP